MGKIKWNQPSNDGSIKPPKIPKNENIVFSFAYFSADSEINCSESDSDYFHTLISRLKTVGQMSVKQFKTCHAVYYKPLRAHPIDWSHPKIVKTGFGIPQRDDFDEAGWQFSVSKAEHGRVHGFLIDTTFHVVWLDPLHKLYPWD
jgi:hypothetical protein